jgi:hypothetical protein
MNGEQMVNKKLLAWCLVTLEDEYDISFQPIDEGGCLVRSAEGRVFPEQSLVQGMNIAITLAYEQDARNEMIWGPNPQRTSRLASLVSAYKDILKGMNE